MNDKNLALTERTRRLLLLGASTSMVFGLCFLATQNLLWLALLALLSPIVGLLCYAELHEHYHSGYRLFGKQNDLIGISYSALLGMSWVLYRAHHANHHRFNNDVGDYSRTLDKNDQPIVGWRYLGKCALVPYVLQLIPFLSFIGMKKDKRSALAFVDETARVALRLAMFALFGWIGLLSLLVWQGIFILALFYLNYLQHFSTEVGHGVYWPHSSFNRHFLNLGLHDQHHAHPAAAAATLSSMTSREPARNEIGLFSLPTFFLFLFFPRRLSAKLLGDTFPQGLKHV